MGKILGFFLILVTALILGSPVSAATIPYLITEGIPGFRSHSGNIFLTKEFTLDYQTGKMIISGAADGTGSTWVDDAMEVFVTHQDGSKLLAKHAYHLGCTSIKAAPPLEFSRLFEKGINTVRVKLSDVCGFFAGSSSMYLVNTGAPDPTPAKTPLILIPGIGGSELKVGEDTFWLDQGDGHGGVYNHTYPKDEKVWVNESEAAKIGQDDYFDVLRMREDGITSEADITPTGDFYPGAYQQALDFFTSNGYELDKTLFIFPYDWRKDIAETSALLDAKIQHIKQQTEADKVDIISHSMGGLVARNYISNPDKAKNVRKLFTLGTPHLGSVNAIKSLIYGDCITKFPFSISPVCLGLNSSEVKDVLQNSIGIYELLTTQKYYFFYDNSSNSYPYPYRINANSLDYSQIKNLLTLRGYNTLLYTPSETFHVIDSNLQNTNEVEVIVIAGSGIPTLGQIIEKENIDLYGNKVLHKDKLSVNGDDTVPLFSASLNDPFKNLSLSGDAKVFYTKQNHGDLPGNGAALNLVKNILEDDYQLPEGVSDHPLLLNKGKLLSAHSPVNIHVYDQNNNHTGLTQNGDIEINIPGSSYDSLDDAKFIYLPDTGIYTIKFEATGEGSFDFKIRKFENDQNSETILYKEIPLTSNTKAETIFDTLSSEPPVIKVDKDGDGNIDLNIEKFSILEGDANYDYTPPTISFDVNPKTIWPPNNKMADVNISGTITDENPYLITIIVDDEYDLIEPTITTYHQTEFNQTLKLEASRKGEDKDGRKYMIKILATDLAGNTSLVTKEILVPHDQRSKK